MSNATAAAEKSQARVKGSFLNCNAAYSIEDGVQQADLLEDAGNWLEAAHGSIHLLLIGLEGPEIVHNPRIVCRMLYGVLTSLEMTKGVVEAAIIVGAGRAAA